MSDDEGTGITVIKIVIPSLLGVLIIVMIIFLIIRCYRLRNKKKIESAKDNNTQKNEMKVKIKKRFYIDPNQGNNFNDNIIATTLTTNSNLKSSTKRKVDNYIKDDKMNQNSNSENSSKNNTHQENDNNINYPKFKNNNDEYDPEKNYEKRMTNLKNGIYMKSNKNNQKEIYMQSSSNKFNKKVKKKIEFVKEKDIQIEFNNIDDLIMKKNNPIENNIKDVYEESEACSLDDGKYMEKIQEIENLKKINDIDDHDAEDVII
jgi:hypothetical protein